MSQPDPTPNNSTPVWELVIADMLSRDQVGRQRYGTPLQAHNGRDALQDAYEEALDLAVYLRQEIEERKALQRELTETKAFALRLAERIFLAHEVLGRLAEKRSRRDRV